MTPHMHIHMLNSALCVHKHHHAYSWQEPLREAQSKCVCPSFLVLHLHFQRMLCASVNICHLHLCCCYGRENGGWPKHLKRTCHATEAINRAQSAGTYQQCRQILAHHWLLHIPGGMLCETMNYVGHGLNIEHLKRDSNA